MPTATQSLSLVSQALESVVELSYCYETWWALVNRENKAAFGAPSERYDVFFSTVTRSLLLSTTVIAHQLFEKRKKGDTVSIETILRSSLKIDPALESKIRLDIQSHRPAVLKVFALRNEVYGHRSSASTPEEIFQKVAITQNQIREVVDLARRCIAQLANAVGERDEVDFLEEIDSVSVWVDEDLREVMRVLHENI